MHFTVHWRVKQGHLLAKLVFEDVVFSSTVLNQRLLLANDPWIFHTQVIDIVARLARSDAASIEGDLFQWWQAMAECKSDNITLRRAM